jgi:hypothetical protein
MLEIRSVVAAGRIVTSAIILAGSVAYAGPVLEYREGPRYCPRDRAAGSPAISEADAIARARTWLPDGFCGPGRRIDGCDADAEYVHDSWRVYAHQYKLRGGRRDWQGLEHSYVILDRVGNCLANIPGTPEGGGP